MELDEGLHLCFDGLRFVNHVPVDLSFLLIRLILRRTSCRCFLLSRSWR